MHTIIQNLEVEIYSA